MKDSKYKHDAVAFVANTKPEEISRIFCEEYRAYIISVEFSGHDTLIQFSDGRATLSPAANGLRLRVEATDLATFHGIRTLLLFGLDLCKAGSKR